MDTSGLMVFALTEQSHRTLSIDFMEGRVFKQYDAVLRGHLPREKTAACVHGPAGDEGIIDLKFRLDPENRPYQVYDPVNGKRGITRWKKVNSRKIERLGMTRILFTPETGRTHQLRLHSAHPDGLGLPIAGDRLYGTRKEGERLMLHACVLEFNHPFDGRTMRFDCPSGF
jgi:tRNA pseudouridine32 synthase/23S rRNA pseudouridine746 synthase